MEPNSDIISKISKLFRLADSKKNSSEEEAMLAMQKAKELMAKHSIAMADLEMARDRDKRGVQTGEKEAYRRTHQYFTKYERWLAQAVAHLTTTKVIFAPEGFRKITMRFFGEVTDVQIAVSIYPLLLKAIRNGAHREYGKGWSSAHRNYADGFAYRLMERARDSKVDLTPKEEQTYALVLASKALQVRDQFALAHPHIRQMRPSPSRTNNEEAFDRGHQDGGKVNLNFKNSLVDKT